MIINDYGINVKPITSRISQSNAILERAHQTIGNILHTFKVQDMVLDFKNPWDDGASSMFAPKGLSAHYNSSLLPISLWVRFNNKSTSQHTLGVSKETKTRPYQYRQQTQKLKL